MRLSKSSLSNRGSILPGPTKNKSGLYFARDASAIALMENGIYTHNFEADPYARCDEEYISGEDY